jgi:hypothetical protein
MAPGVDKQAVLNRIDFRTFYSKYVEIPSRNGTEEVTVKCCFHEDKNPSMSLNLKTGLYSCHGCDAKGDIFTMLKDKEGLKFSDALKYLAEQVGLFSDSPRPARKPESVAEPTQFVDAKLVEQYHKTLLTSPDLMNYVIHKRGITEPTMRNYQIGYCMERRRYTLPVKDSEGRVVNVRMYRPDAPEGQPKIESWGKGFGSARLFPSDKVTEKDLVVCEGEWDCLLLRQEGVAAYTSTCGADSFPPACAQKFAGRKITICYDIDEPGRKGAARTAGLLSPVAKEVRVMTLPIKTPANGDVTDFFVTHGLGLGKFQDVMWAAPVFVDGRVRPGPKAFRNLVPPSSFFDLYVTMAGETTDAPPEFHLASALSAVSGVLGAKVWLHAWGKDVFPNLWIILVAPSGFYRKSTAMNMGLRMVRSAKPENVLPNDFTQEKLIETLGNRAQGVIPVYEFGALLKMLGKDYNASLKEFLTEIYDGSDYSRDTRGGGKVTITRPAVSILSATTVDWLVGNARESDFRSGFFARFLFWVAREKPKWKGLGEQEEHELVSTLKYMLAEMAEITGQVRLSKDRIAQYNDWLRGFESEVNDQRLPGELQGFYTRLGMYVLKFAVLYEVGTTMDLDISEQSMDYAIRLAEYLKSHLIALFEDEMNTSRDAKELRNVRDLIAREPEISRDTLLRRSKLTARHLDELLTTLIQSEEIVVIRIDTGGRPKLTYRLRDSCLTALQSV